MLRKIRNAIISVYEKEGLTQVLKVLKKYKINIISSGGTYKYIKKKGYKVREVSEFTGFEEMLDGRVKTLHPKIHSGILFNRRKNKHIKEMSTKNYESIDLVIVNFYPFLETLNKTNNPKKIIENIDIGGPTLVRAAAKNFEDVTIVSDCKDYINLIDELKKNKGKTTLKFREKMANKAFSLTSGYDATITNWFNKKSNIQFPERKIFFGNKIDELRYGENPHQKSSIYSTDQKNLNLGFNKISGKELSYNNYNDIYAGLELLLSIKKIPTTVIIKHANPCGVASNKSPLQSFKDSKSSDPVSAFGGIVACNFNINISLATEINKTFFEVILARGFDKNALKLLKKKKNMRLIDISNFSVKNRPGVKIFDNSFLLQEKDEVVFDKKKIKFVTKAKPTKLEINEAEFAFRVCKFVKSNAIVIVKNKATIGIGAGQQNRLDSCRIASEKAKQFQPQKLLNSVAASDAFFPFPDGIKTLIKSGVKIIVQPGGSIRDQEVIDAANKAKIKMIFTGVRHFNH